MNAPPPASPPLSDRRSWLGRNWVWFVPAGCLGLVFLFAAFFAGVFMLVMASIRHSWVYGEAVDRARAHPAVVRELGEPIRAGWWILGNIDIAGSSGSADLTIPISGPRNSARILLTAEKEAGAWQFEYLAVEVEGSGDVIDLLGFEADRLQTAGVRPPFRGFVAPQGRIRPF